MKQEKTKANPKQKTAEKKLFTEVYLVLDSDMKIIEGQKELAEKFTISSNKGNSKEFFLLLPKSNSHKLKSLIKQVIGEKKYQQAETNIKSDNQKYICSVDIIPKGNNALLLIKDISERKNIISKLKKSQKQLRELSKHLQNVREEERKRFAMEIHDDLGQKLTALQIEVGLLSQKIKNSNDEISVTQIYKRLGTIRKLIDDTLSSKKNLLYKFKLDFLEEFGLIESFRQYLEEFQARYNIEFYFYSDWKHLELDYNKSVTLYRIFQEALTNIVKHSGATKIHVSLEDRKHKIVMKIEDNGRGITKDQIEKPEGLGIFGMEERMILDGGTLSIKGKPGKGTVVQVSTKIAKQERND